MTERGKIAVKNVCIGLIVLALLPSLAAAAAEPGTPASAPTRITRVALFKNGLGFFVREGTLPVGARHVLLGPYAAPSHGTFWVSTPSRLRLQGLVARSVAVQEEVEARSVPELLRANVGREVHLGAPHDYGAPVGVILSFSPERPGPPQARDAYSMGTLHRDTMPLDGPWGFMLVRTRTGPLAVNPSHYGQVTFLTDDVATDYIRERPGFELEARFAEQARGDDWIGVTYLAKGITWAPSYLLDITDDETATLTAKALIINEAEDIEGAHVDLVTGFPNLQFADVASPIAQKENLAAFLNALTRGQSSIDASVLSQVMANVPLARMERAGRGGGMGGGGFAGPMPGYGAAAAGRAAEDLFLYPLDSVDLAAGETGYFPLFTESLPYTEFYQWDIPDYVGERDRYISQPERDAQTAEQVWHSLRIPNETDLPWTTAPAQLMESGQIIGQDILTFTPPEGEATVRITQAVSVKAEQTEVEVSRERDAVHLYGDSFDRVTIEGTLQVTNYTSEPVALEITKSLSGDVKQTSPSAEDITLAAGLARMNASHQLTWKLDLEPGDSREITYLYEALIRR
jgi:hypothetical protein